MNIFFRALPLTLSFLLIALIILFWPQTNTMNFQLIPWVNIIIMVMLSLILCVYGLRLLLQKKESSPGSRLRAKLVIGMVGMLLIPAGVIQIAANQMVDKGFNVWFDVRVDTLLDRALNLAQGFYGRIDHDLQHDLFLTMNDDTLRSEIATLPISFALLSQHLREILTDHSWQSLKLFDRNERLITAVQSQGLSQLDTGKFSEQAKLSIALGKITTETRTVNGGESVVAYAPVIVHQNTVGLLEASVQLPTGFVENARAVEADYSSYRQLERHRQSIAETFKHVMLLITLLVVLLVGMISLSFSRRLTAPIGNLAHALKRISEGKLNTTIHTAPDDELGSLVNSFNQMSERLRGNVAALEQAQQELTQTLQASQQRQSILETLLENLQSGAVLLTPEHKILLINQAFYQTIGVPLNQAQSTTTVKALLQSKKLQPVTEFFDELVRMASGALQQEIEITINHRTKQILARGVHIKTPDTSTSSALLILIDDVSQLAEAQRHRAWAEVAQRLAHEIKNPLTPIKLSTERLQRRFRKQVDSVDVFDTCTDAIITQVDRLQRLIGDFSTLARLPKPKCAEVAAHVFFKEANDLYNSYKQLRVISPDPSIHCWCDADQIRQVIINLIENALAATHSMNTTEKLSSPLVEFSLSHEKGCVYFHIKDYGSGIPDEVALHIFEAYFSTKADGSGLGLSIAKRIADEHHGDLELLSCHNPTHFRLKIPDHPVTEETL